MRPAALFLLAWTLACSTAPQPQSTPTPAPPPVAAIPPTPAAPPAAARPQNPNQEKNDQIARAVLEKIAGRENEPAEQVFKNIQAMKGVPAGRFVRIMNMGYSRALGVGCLHCHYGPDYSSDEKRPKRAAREMMAMHRMINERLRSMENLEGKPEERAINCSTCHRGRTDPMAE